MTNSYYYTFYEPLTDGMEMGFLFHEYKHAVCKYELFREEGRTDAELKVILKKQKEIERFMQTAKPFPKVQYIGEGQYKMSNEVLDRSYD